MNKNQKTLGFFLFINCIFFVGIGLITSREISQSKQNPLNKWLVNGVLRTSHSLHLQRNRRKEQMLLTLRTKEPAYQKKMAESFNIVTIFEKKNNGIVKLYGSQETSPHPVDLFDKNTIAAHKDKENIYLTYFYGEKEKDSDQQLAVVIQRQISSLIDALELIGIHISIIENSSSEKTVVFSTLPEDGATELLTSFDFEKIEGTVFDDSENLMAGLRQITLGKQRYLILAGDLVSSKDLKQKIAYTLPMPEYEIISLSDFSLLVLVLFFVTSIVSFVIWKKLES